MCIPSALPSKLLFVQVVRVKNSMLGQKSLMIKLRIQYNTNGGQIVEQAQVSAFPPGY